MQGESTKPTARSRSLARGNRLYENAVFTLGFDEAVIRRLMVGVLSIIGSGPDLVTLAEMCALLPEIERRLKLVAPYPTYAPRLTQLQLMLMGWQE